MPGEAWQGVAMFLWFAQCDSWASRQSWPGKDGLGLAWQGLASPGLARHGKASHHHDQHSTVRLPGDSSTTARPMLTPSTRAPGMK